MVSAAVAAVGIASSAASSSKQRKAAKNAAQAQQDAAAEAGSISQEQFRQSKNLLQQNFRLAELSQQFGASAALNVNELLAPAQIEAFQQGNVGAQNTLIQGAGLQNKALLGQAFDPSSLEALQIQTDPTLFKASPIDFSSAREASDIKAAEDEAIFQEERAIIFAEQQRQAESEAEAARQAEKFNFKDALTKPSLDPGKLLGGLF